MILEPFLPNKTSSPKNKDIQIESGSFILVESLLDHTAEPIINLPDSSPLYLPSSPLDDSLPNLCPAPSQQKHSNKEEKCPVAVDLEMKSDCIVISSSSNDEIEIFEDDEVPAEEKNKATCDLHDLGIPVYGRPKATLHVEELVKLCFGEVDNVMVSKQKPTSVRTNAVFVVDLQGVNMRSLYADDNGVWSTSSPRNYLIIELENGMVSKVTSSTQHNFTHFVRRQYGTHQATLSEKGITFQRIISTVTSKNGERSRFAVVQYILKGGSEEDVVKPHGNSKFCKRPYYKTDQGVLDKLKDEPMEMKPRKTFKRLMDEAGGPLHSRSASDEPRNIQQIYNARKSSQPSKPDDITSLIAQVKNDPFVHDVTIGTESMQYLLTSEKQLSDIEQFCTNPLVFSIFSIDSTFNVGNYYVTTTCYENLKIDHAEGRYRGKHPLEFGPVFVHTHRDTNIYVSFFSLLQQMNPNLKSIQAIGSDGDEALQNAIEICFQDSIKLLCAGHKRENIERHLKSLKAVTSSINHIIADIFGRERQSEKGLIDSMSADFFDNQLKEYKATWDCLVPGFYTWFVRYQADLFKRHLIAEVTTQARLWTSFNNNRIESINNNLKDWVGRSGKVHVSELNSQVKHLVKTQQQEFEISVYANGQYQLSETRVSLRKDRPIWNRMTAREREECLDLFWKPSSTRGKGARNRVPREMKAGVLLSVSLKDVEWLNEYVPADIVREIWMKSEKLLTTPNALVQAPGFDGIFVRHSPDDTGIQPHLVTQSASGKISCDCNLFKSSKVCEHAVSFAQYNGKIEQFLEWRRKSKSSTNVTELVMSGLVSGKKGAKPKVVKPRKGGRKPLNTPTVKSSIRKPLLEGISTQESLQALQLMEQEQPFEIIYLFQTKAVSCYGCGLKYKRDEENNTLVVRKFCEREFTTVGQKKSLLQFAYFHLRISCIRKRFPDFEKRNLIIAKESKDVIPIEVSKELEEMGIKI